MILTNRNKSLNENTEVKGYLKLKLKFQIIIEKLMKNI